MEDIISKNIFNDKDLCKLAPDYAPTDVLFRMEMRRSMVKDTHKHGIPRSYWQRKSTEKSKDYIMNKEIVDIRNCYKNNNLKNQIILKHGVTSRKLKRLMHDNRLNLKDFDEGLDIYLTKSPNPIEELIVTNDEEFKLNIKPKVEKNQEERIKAESFNVKQYHEKCSDCTDEHYKDEIDDFMRVECRFTHTSCNEINNSDNNKNYQLEINDKETVYTHTDFRDSCSQNGTSEHANDLQTLLIMMAISTKTNENDDCNIVTPKYVSDVNKNNIPSDTILYNTVADFNDQCGDIANILNVTPLRIQVDDKEKNILTKYVKMWKDYVSRRRDFMSKQRQAALDNFFDKLSKKKLITDQSSESVHKSKLLARDYSTYQHRYKVQKHIIALQKVKLEEQNRLIEELKYNKIIEASKQSVEDMKEQVRKTYYEIDRQLKPKIKCLTNELKIQEIEEPALVLHCLKVPQFLQRMEKRAREREEKHAMIRERRRQIEEERIRLKQQVELAKAEMDKEEKMKRIIELREKRKKERIEAIRKKQHVERLRALIVMADLHYERYLMISYGIRPLRKLLGIKRDNMEKAKVHYVFQLKKNAFLHLMWYTEDMCFERNYKAEDFHRKKMLRNTLETWKQVQQQYIVKKQVADDYYDLYVVQVVFRHFCWGIQIVKKENELKYQKAIIYHNSNLMFKIFTCWRTLPALNALKREQDARKARWRDKVLKVVPDYIPPDD